MYSAFWGVPLSYCCRIMELLLTVVGVVVRPYPQSNGTLRDSLNANAQKRTHVKVDVAKPCRYDLSVTPKTDYVADKLRD